MLQEIKHKILSSSVSTAKSNDPHLKNMAVFSSIFFIQGFQMPQFKLKNDCASDMNPRPEMYLICCNSW